MPVYGTIASRFNDDGTTALYQEILGKLAELGLAIDATHLPRVETRKSTARTVIVPSDRVRYLAEIATTVRDYHAYSRQQVAIARERQQLIEARRMLGESKPGNATDDLDALVDEREQALDDSSRKMLEQWPRIRQGYSGDEYVVQVRDREIRTDLRYDTLSGSSIPKVSLPAFEDHGELLKWLLLENLPGSFPFTAGVFAFKRENEDPTRMFAGEGDAFRTNRRFKKLSEHSEAKRLSTAFDSVTLYGCDPDERPDIYGKVGNSGVSIATLEDMKALYDGFDLCSPSTSVSMTINGPAPIILAMYLNTAMDQQLAKFAHQNQRQPTEQEIDRISAWALENIRGTVQADILKEDQGQNTCIFSTEFALKMMGDIQQYFIDHRIRNFYSVSISGYHIAEAGANPISQLAFTLSNGFTFVEAYLARGMHIDDFAPNLSFFFSNGMDPEYTVMGRVARRIWATAMKDRYGANERSQKLKYHIQTSGRSLHAQEMDFNDIRTTLQALIAIYDNCNSLHTNAFDEAITTPTGDSVWRKTRTPTRDPSSSSSSPIWSRKPCCRNSSVSPTAAACSARWRPAISAARSRMNRCCTNTASTTARYRSSASIPFSTRRVTKHTKSSWRARPTRKNRARSNACVIFSRPMPPLARQRSSGFATPRSTMRIFLRSWSTRYATARSAKSPTPCSR
jgi:methylmalonyl-CoA mutase